MSERRDIRRGETVIFPNDGQASIDAISNGELVRCEALDHYAPVPGLKAYLPVGPVYHLATLPKE